MRIGAGRPGDDGAAVDVGVGVGVGAPMRIGAGRPEGVLWAARPVRLVLEASAASAMRRLYDVVMIFSPIVMVVTEQDGGEAP